MSSARSPAASRPETAFGALLRHWRATRRLTQLDLALEAEISARHLSCVETGRAQPSREMVLRLADALEIPLRERNSLLVAAACWRRSCPIRASRQDGGRARWVRR